MKKDPLLTYTSLALLGLGILLAGLGVYATIKASMALVAMDGTESEIVENLAAKVILTVMTGLVVILPGLTLAALGWNSFKNGAKRSNGVVAVSTGGVFALIFGAILISDFATWPFSLPALTFFVGLVIWGFYVIGRAKALKSA